MLRLYGFSTCTTAIVGLQYLYLALVGIQYLYNGYCGPSVPVQRLLWAFSACSTTIIRLHLSIWQNLNALSNVSVLAETLLFAFSVFRGLQEYRETIRVHETAVMAGKVRRVWSVHTDLLMTKETQVFLGMQRGTENSACGSL